MIEVFGLTEWFHNVSLQYLQFVGNFLLEAGYHYMWVNKINSYFLLDLQIEDLNVRELNLENIKKVVLSKF